MRYLTRLIVLAITLSMLNACSTSKSTRQRPQEAQIPSAAATTPLPVDPQITIGQLDNGLRYYIRANQRPEQRAELRLVVNAGSILEDDDQQGLAHFVEHMAFNGTKQFAKHELVDYLESIGMRFGPDLNAYTSFDETVYMLQIPTDSIRIVETAFQILKEWASAVAFEDEEIDKERGVVVEEWRLGRGAQARMRDRQFPLLFKNSRYADRLPIGKKEILENFEPETLRRFYRDWYRPDLMAVIAVGNFDTAFIEAQIRQTFGELPAAEAPRPRVHFPVPDNDKTIFAIASDPEATGSSVSIYFKKDAREQNSEAAYRQSIVENLYNGMFNSRLDELRQQPEPPFLYAYSGGSRFNRDKEFYILGAGVPDNGVETALQTLLTEAQRVRQFGFTASELARQKSEMLRGMERAYAERDKSESRQYAAEYIRNFLEDEPIPGIEFEYQLYQKYLPTINLEEINRLAETQISDHNRVVLVNVPEKDGVEIPTESSLNAVFESVAGAEIAPYVDNVSDAPLIGELPPPGTVVKETAIPEIGVTEWQLSNGSRVILKPTDFKNDQILFSAYSPGGNSLLPEADYIPALTAAAVVAQSGVGEFSLVELEKKLAGKVAGVSPSIGTLEEGLSGSASPQDVETLFQLIHLYFTQPRADSSAYLSYQSRIRAYLANRNADPGTALRDTLALTLAQYHYRARPWSEATLESMDLQRSLAIYRERFADASDFTFLFVGNLDPAQFRTLATRYLASLPNLSRKESWRDPGITSPEGVIKKAVYKGLEPKSRVEIVFTGPFQWSRQNRYDINALAAVLRIKLRETLREDKGGTYGVSVGANPARDPHPEYEFSISFGCAPERVDELTQLVFQQIDSLKQAGIDPSYVQKVQETQRRKNETDLKRNGYWLNVLEFYDSHQESLLGILETDDYIDRLTPETIRQAAGRYLNLENYVQVTLFPAQGGQ